MQDDGIYDILAGHYDALAGDIEASKNWAEWIINQVGHGSILDCACGTGDITNFLNESRNVRAEGMDLSEKMIEEARRKYPGIKFTVGDMTDLKPYGMYDAISVLCDSFNYLQDKDQVKAFLNEACHHLNDNGLLFFDIHSQDRIEEFAPGYVETGTFDDGVQVQWEIQSEGPVLYQDLAFYFPDGTFAQEHHRQTIWSPKETEQMISEKFDIVDICTDLNEPGISEGEKYFYICRKKGNV